MRHSLMTKVKSGVKRLAAGAGFELRRLQADYTNSSYRLLEMTLRKNTCEAYEQLYGSDEWTNYYLSPGRLAFYEAIASLAQEISPNRIVDVGCGAGHFLHRCSETFTCDLFGAEPTASGVRRATALLPKATIKKCGIYEVSQFFDNSAFDLVCCIQVLEHLENPEMAINELVKLKSASGKMLISVPDGRKDTWDGHINFWSETSLRNFLTRWGCFEIKATATDLIAVEK